MKRLSDGRIIEERKTICLSKLSSTGGKDKGRRRSCCRSRFRSLVFVSVIIPLIYFDALPKAQLPHSYGPAAASSSATAAAASA